MILDNRSSLSGLCIATSQVTVAAVAVVTVMTARMKNTFTTAAIITFAATAACSALLGITLGGGHVKKMQLAILILDPHRMEYCLLAYQVSSKYNRIFIFYGEVVMDSCLHLSRASSTSCST